MTIGANDVIEDHIYVISMGSVSSHRTGNRGSNMPDVIITSDYQSL